MMKINSFAIAAVAAYQNQRPGNTGFFVPELLASIAGVFLEMGQNWENLYFKHKKRPSITRKALKVLVGRQGFEPWTHGLRVSRTIDKIQLFNFR